MEEAMITMADLRTSTMVIIMDLLMLITMAATIGDIMADTVGMGIMAAPKGDIMADTVGMGTMAAPKGDIIVDTVVDTRDNWVKELTAIHNVRCLFERLTGIEISVSRFS
jgi:hypothetical protein